MSSGVLIASIVSRVEDTISIRLYGSSRLALRPAQCGYTLGFFYWLE